jgi:CubicO group peptidase (beta-lactamase class C family)
VRRTRAVRQPDAPAEAAAAGLAVSVVDLVSLGLLHLRPGMPNLLPVTDAQQMRQAVAVADPFGLADGWGLGLALFRCGTTTWVGHDGNADGTSCYLRIDPANGWIVAFTSNANVGAAMWREILVELGGAGMPIEPPRTAAPQHAPITPPVECVGMYANSDVEFAVTVRQGGRLYLTADGDASAALTFFEGLTFALRDPDSGRMVLGGRFVRDPVTGKVEGIQIGGRVARRRVPATREASRRLVA